MASIVPPEIQVAGWTSGNIVVPTHVYGVDAEQVAAQWGAKWSTGSFAEFRKTMHKDKPLVVAFTDGLYEGQDWYLGDRPNQEVYLIGLGDLPTLKNDSISVSRFSKLYIKGLDLQNCGITSQVYRDDTTDIYITQCHIRDTVGDQNAVGTPSEAGTYPFGCYVWDTTFEQCGGLGNTTHMMYIHGRPNGLLWVDNVQVLGTRGCSAFKSTCVRNEIRNSYLSTVQDRTNLAKGFKAAMLVDVPADSESIVDNNQIIMWRGKVDAVAGQVGLDIGAVVWRARREFHGSDRPPYLSAEWLDKEFWLERAQPFRKEVTNNHFVLLGGSRKCPPVNAQGTHPRRAVRQFSSQSIIEATHPDWWERDYTLSRGNTYEGFPVGYDEWAVFGSEGVASVEAGAKWDPVTKKRTVPSVIVTEWT